MEEKDLMPWQMPGVPWKNESQFWNWVRGGLRQVWSKHPVKTTFRKEVRVRVPNPNPNGRKDAYGAKCASCGGLFPFPPPKDKRIEWEKATGKEIVTIEINHKFRAGSLKTKEDLAKFAGNLLFVTHDDLEPCCKKCHAIISYAEKNNMSIKDAEIEKEVIKVMNNGKGCPEKAWLIQHGVQPGSNNKERRNQVREVISKIWKE